MGCGGDTDSTLRVPGLGVTGRLGNWLRTQPRGREASEAERQQPEREEGNKRSQAVKTKAQESIYRRITER